MYSVIFSASGAIFSAAVSELSLSVATLAQKITGYIVDHQDDAAQEDRWRTIMKRDMTKSFKKVEAGVQKVETGVQKRFEDVHSKMDETIQLVKELAVLVQQR